VNDLQEGQRSTCKWEQCGKPIVVRRFDSVEGNSRLEWVHDNQGMAPTRNCPSWTPLAEPVDG
jgi:hypothetical protein